MQDDFSPREQGLNSDASNRDEYRDSRPFPDYRGKQHNTGQERYRRPAKQVYLGPSANHSECQQYQNVAWSECLCHRKA